MKKLIIILLVILFPLNLYSKDYVNIADGGRIVGKLSVTSLKELVGASKKYKDIIEAQTEDRLIIVTSDVKDTAIKGKYEATLKMSWKNSEGAEVNYVTVLMFLRIKQENQALIPEWRIIYRDVAEIGFPVSFSLLILLLILI